MPPSEVIETYIEDVVRLLPRRLRDDVAAELRSLLTEELHARASGGPPDEALALALVRGYGRPNEVAARYQPPSAVIDPADTTNFIRAAVIGVGALLLLSVLSLRRPAQPDAAGNGATVSILSWLGLLVVAFGVKNWLRRRRPAAPWQPRDRDRASRLGTALLVPIALFFVVFYGAPIWVLDVLSGGRLETDWAAYTADFQRLRLPCFLGLLVGLLALQSVAAIQGRWSRLTRRLSLGLNLALACLVLSFAVEGNLFESGLVDRIARDVLAVVAVVYVPCVGVQLYGEIGRLDRAAAAKQA